MYTPLQTTLRRITLSMTLSLLGLCVVLPVLGQGGNLGHDVGLAERQKVASQWARLIERFSSAHPTTLELNRYGDLAVDMNLRFGEHSLGVIQDPASSSNFITADYFPRMMAAYCYW